MLAKDREHTDARATVAEVCHDPVVAATLARDPHPAVRGCVVLNPGLTPDDAEMRTRDPIDNVRANVDHPELFADPLLDPMSPS